MNGLVLTAGGARGAYQAGVLKRVGELDALKGCPSLFKVIVGASAGSINSAYLAARSAEFTEATRKLADVWAQIRVQEVFRTDIASLSLGASRWIRDLSFGGVFGGGEAESLLDASPLRAFLARHLPLEGIAQSIHEGHLYALAITATSYYSGKSIIFIQGRPGHALWNKIRRTSVSTPIGIDHVLASCAIPIVFQPVLVHFDVGDFYLGDGGLRLVNPCSPAIRLGAHRIFAVGIRSQAAALARSRKELTELNHEGHRYLMKRPPLAQVFGVALNAIFLDHLDTDIDHLHRINDLLKFYGAEKIENAELKEPMRRVEAFVVNPSVDLAEIAERHSGRMPKFVRYLMEGLGTSRSQTADLMSYLLFDSHYTRALIQIGYEDASRQIHEIEEYLVSSCATKNEIYQ